MTQLRLLFILTILSIPRHALAAPKVQFSRQVLPLLKRECMVCHSGPAAPSGYRMETAEQLLAGGRHGAAVKPSKGAQSNIIRYLLGQLQPQMPPGKPLSPATVALLSRWIDEGAKIDSMTVLTSSVVRRPSFDRSGQKDHVTAGPVGLTPHGSRLTTSVAPVTALAFSPDGKLLAAGCYQAVRLIDPATGRVIRTLTGPADQVLSLAWSSDGRWLAAAGGLAGAFGEVCLWDEATWGKPRIRRRHTDTIYGIAWRPGAPEFATASLDKTVSIWDSRSLIVTRTLKDHADAVFCAGYSPDGRWLATGSADRSAKLYQLPVASRQSPASPGGLPKEAAPDAAGSPKPAGDWTRPVASLSHGDAVTALAFSPKGDLLVTACTDKQVRVWPVRAGSAENPLRSHSEEDAVNAVAFSQDGSAFAWGAANHKVRAWNGDVSSQKWAKVDPSDWIYAVAVSPDGKIITAGCGDGKLYFWSQPDGKLMRSQLLSSSASVAAASSSPGPR